MSTLSTPALSMLWTGIEKHKAAQARLAMLEAQDPPAPDTEISRPPTPPTASELAARFPRYVARVWLRRLSMPGSFEDMSAQVLSDGEDMSRRRAWLEEMYQTHQLLERMADLDWRVMDPADRSTWPQPEQNVFYFFDIVGTHPGQFYTNSDDALPDSFTGGAGFQSASGFLDVFDVSHWAPRPV